jgi:hypothetical protein
LLNIRLKPWAFRNKVRWNIFFLFFFYQNRVALCNISTIRTFNWIYMKCKLKNQRMHSWYINISNSIVLLILLSNTRDWLRYIYIYIYIYIYENEIKSIWFMIFMTGDKGIHWRDRNTCSPVSLFGLLSN